MCERDKSVKKIKAILFGGVMSVLISGLIGCGLVDKTESEAIADNLSAKYNKQFVVTAIGNRYNSDTATAYAYAAEDPSLCFVVKAYATGELVSDSYAYRTVCRKAENTLNDAFKDCGMDTENYVVFNVPEYKIPADMSIENYISKSNCDELICAMVLKKDSNANGVNISEAIAKAGKDLPDITVVYKLFLLSARDFEKANDIIRKETTIFDMIRLKSYGLEDNVSDCVIEASGGKANKTVDEIANDLNGEVK